MQEANGQIMKLRSRRSAPRLAGFSDKGEPGGPPLAANA
jgi:hypothetical protein